MSKDRMVQFKYPSYAAIRAFTIMEVMISLTILAVGISAILSNMFTLKSARDAARDAAIVENLANELVERFSGARWEALGTPAIKWSLHRPFSASVGNPLTDKDDGSDNSLITLGILRQPTGMKDLRVYIDYYRGMTELDAAGLPIVGKSGLMDGEGSTFNSLTELRAIWRNETSILPYRLDPLIIPTIQVSEDRPLVIRILINSSEFSRPLVFFTGRKQ